MNPTAIYSKSGKGVQEASGKTSILPRADRAVLSAIDGRATLGEVAQKCGKAFDGAFEALIAKLDKDGFVREVSPGVAPPAPKLPPKPPSKPAGKAAAKPGGSGVGEDLDFSSSLDFSATMLPSKKGAPPPPASTQSTDPRASPEAEKRAQEDAAPLARARQEAETRAQKDRDRAKLEAEAKLRVEAEARLRAEAAAKGQADIEAKLRAESEAKVKAAREAAVRAAAEAKAKAEAEAKAKVDVERKAREEAERRAKEEADRVRQEAERARKEAEAKAAREADELRKKLEEERAKAEAERKAREHAEKKAREETERARKEAEEKARAEAEAMRRQLEEERRKLDEERKREAEERKRREEEDRKRREAEERQRREDEERRRKEETARRREEEARAKEAEERERAAAKERRESDSRAAKSAAETSPRIPVPPPPTPPAAEASGSFDAGLLADLESFGKRDEEEAKAKEESERKARAAAEQKAREEAERQARDAAERKRRDEEERRRQEEEARRAREDEERRAREEEERGQRDAEERRRRTKEPAGAAQHAKPADDDIGVTDEDLDMDDVKQDERALGAAARREARQREAARADATRAEAPARAEAPEELAPRVRRKPVNWGKAVGISVAVLLIAGLGALQLMPLSASDYEKAASAALGRPVRIASAHLSVFSGMRVTLRGVVIGDAKLGDVSGSPELGSIFGERKAFNRIDLEAPTLSPALAAGALFGKAGGGNFTVKRVVAHKLKLQGPLALPALDADLSFGDDGALRSATLTGPDGLNVALTPKGAELEFELNASQFTLPVAPEITLANFGMKGTATPDGLRAASWDSAMLEGRIAGTANVRWGSSWTAEGTVQVRGINAAVFAPTLLFEGKADGNGRFSASGADPEKLGALAHVEGNFGVGRGVLGSVDLSRAIQSGGRGATGSTPFTELSAQGVYDKGAVSLRNVNITAGSLNAGAAVDIAPSGALSGRIVADVKTANANLRATVSLGGTVKEPQIR